VNLHHPHNLRRRFYSCIDGGPTFLHGAVAFTVFMLRLVLRRNVEAAAAVGEGEPPLSETFRGAVVGR
ncbi:MAG: hypothetical protein OEM82_08180, partial [Acidobacteriota bacterium]|nr:hypothetical protein [Acidobacteriota bacterium]